MNVKPNIGILNALIRITIGLTVVSWSSAKLVKKPWRDSYLLIALFGSMKVAEGIVRFCPVTALYEQRLHMMKNMKNAGEQTAGDFEQVVPYNPT